MTVPSVCWQAMCSPAARLPFYVPERHQLPDVELRPAGDPEHFPPGVKHRYPVPP